MNKAKIKHREREESNECFAEREKEYVCFVEKVWTPFFTGTCMVGQTKPPKQVMSVTTDAIQLILIV